MKGDEELEEGPLSIRRMLDDGSEEGGEVGELLGIAAHDLRSPLANIRSYAGMILSGRGAPLEPRVERAARVIVKNADRGLRQVDDLLDLIRSQSGQLSLEEETFSLEALIRDGIRRAEPLAAENDVKLQWEADGAELLLTGDEEMLGRAFAALVEAAIRRSPAGGEVPIEAEVRPTHIVVTARDAGGTPDAEELEEAFDWLYQVVTNNRLVAGLSLGLCSAVVEAHGGTVGVDPADGGARWFISLPRSSGA